MYSTSIHSFLCQTGNVCLIFDWLVSRGVVVPERGRTPFRQIFLSRNGAPVNIVYHSRNTDTAAFRQISSYYKKLPYTRNLANWFSGKSLKLLPPDVIF